ncbi:MAG: hypothetical protein HFE83_04395 [Lachnospiraceae bacterium]|nr:hypothetical protein [Lachnospiraceae bacterium]
MPETELEFEDLTFRTHGTRALETLKTMLNFAKNYPVVSVFDSDNDCIIELLEKYTYDKKNVDYAAINFAVDEAEAWLLADRDGLAEYFRIPVERIPMKGHGALEISSSIPYKTSLFILTEIAPLSNNASIKKALAFERPGKKPSTYNSIWKKYIDEIWNIGSACTNSESLERAVKRIKRMLAGKRIL